MQLLCFLKHVTNPHSTWKQSVSLTEWEGVDLDEDGRPEYIEFTNQRLKGELSWKFLLDTVNTCILYGTELIGTIPWSSLPRALTCLELQHCKFSGALPTRLNPLPESVSTLKLNENLFSGPIELEALPQKLELFSITNNLLTGEFDLTRLPRTLKTVSASENGFTGPLVLTSLPPTLGSLHLRGNAFSGSIDLTKLPKTLHRLDLSCNELSGVVRWRKLPRVLVIFRLMTNRFSSYDPPQTPDIMLI